MIDEIETSGAIPILDAIEAAEEVTDPLEGLAERSTEDPGAAFTPEALKGLSALKKVDRAAFEALRDSAQESGLPS